MTKEICLRTLGGEIRAIPSKSVAHRLLICAALSDGPTKIHCPQTSRDIEATAACLSALGANITYCEGYYTVDPIQTAVNNAVLPCGESGSTLRFLIPLVCGLGVCAEFEMQGRLPDRPLSPLQEELEAHGITFNKEQNRLTVGGTLTGHDFTLAANVSSQFISGLLFMLTLCGGTLTLTDTVESGAYIDMTVNALQQFGALLTKTDRVFTLKKSRLQAQTEVQTEGDWSNAAFFLCAGCLGMHPVTVKGLNLHSAQGDKQILNILRAFGAKIECNEDAVTVWPSELTAADIDAAQIPDLVPVLALTACAAKGRTRIFNAQRLRLKESDRLQTTADLLNDLGGKASVTPDGLLIEGKTVLHGGVADAANDHRIAMSAAIAAILCENGVTLHGAQAVEKSYPDFWSDLEKLKRV